MGVATGILPGVHDCTEEHFKMCNNTYKDVDNNLGSRIPPSARILPEIDFLLHDKKMWGEEVEQRWSFANEVRWMELVGRSPHIPEALRQCRTLKQEELWSCFRPILAHFGPG